MTVVQLCAALSKERLVSLQQAAGEGSDLIIDLLKQAADADFLEESLKRLFETIQTANKKPIAEVIGRQEELILLTALQRAYAVFNATRVQRWARVYTYKNLENMGALPKQLANVGVKVESEYLAQYLGKST